MIDLSMPSLAHLSPITLFPKVITGSVVWLVGDKSSTWLCCCVIHVCVFKVSGIHPGCLKEAGLVGAWLGCLYVEWHHIICGTWTWFILAQEYRNATSAILACMEWIYTCDKTPFALHIMEVNFQIVMFMIFMWLEYHDVTSANLTCMINWICFLS